MSEIIETTRSSEGQPQVGSAPPATVATPEPSGSVGERIAALAKLSHGSEAQRKEYASRSGEMDALVGQQLGVPANVGAEPVALKPLGDLRQPGETRGGRARSARCRAPPCSRLLSFH
jgi:hypothetical protein